MQEKGITHVPVRKVGISQKLMAMFCLIRNEPHMDILSDAVKLI